MTFPGSGSWGRPAVVSAVSGEVLRYRDLDARGREICAPMGRAKELLLLLCRNDAFTVAAYSGALTAGHAVALLDGQSDPQILADLVLAYRPAWLGGPQGVAERLGARGVPIQGVTPVHGGELIRTGHPSQSGLHPDLSVLLATSGTTGSRRFVRLSEQNLRANAKAIAGYLDLTPDELPITSLPLHYTFGLSVLNSHLFAGAAVVLTEDSLIQKPFWETFRTHGCTSLAGVPFTYQMLERIGFREMDLPTLTTLQQAGGALDLPLTRTYAEYMARRGGRFFVMYGQTEATARMAYVPPARLLDKLGSAGVAIPGGRLRIDAGGSAFPGARVTGEVVYEGPNVMMGYSSGPVDLGRGDDLHGTLRTGDIGYLDEDGFLFLVGRSKRIAKVFGLRVNLDEVELVLRENGPAAVVGAPDAIWAFCAFGTDEALADLAKTLARRYRLHPSALHFRRVEAVPTLESGKIDYGKVQAWMTT
jgi:acyl-CoA synthetase (AMP-forming)/AMP-acid ligase II